MRYAVLDGGKRIRPALVYLTGQALDVPETRLDGPACAVELIHAYSLVHDDLPAMDNDDLRRGKPTCHRAFDEATAILAGDALQSLAFYVLAHDPAMLQDAAVRVQMIMTLADASGSAGMAGGQALDMASNAGNPAVAELEAIHNRKTGALIGASVLLGALSQQRVTVEELRRLRAYAAAIGLAFQIQDDVLDVEGETGTLGKMQGADAARNKATYPALLGLERAKQRARETVDEALQHLAPFDGRADPLRALAVYIVERRH